MSGFSDYMSQKSLNFVTGQQAMPALGNRFLALFTTAPSDSGAGGAEVTGGSYARVQVAGAVTAAGTISTASATITMPNVSGFPWVVPGMNVFDATNGVQIGVVASWVGTTLTLTGNAANNGSGATDSLVFSAWPAASGSAPSSTLNGAAVSFPAATLNWGTVVAFGIYDALTTGNLLEWDYLGNFSWLPCTISAAAPGVVTAKAHGYLASDSVVYTTEYGGVAPTFSQSNLTGLLAAVGPATDTFTVTNGGTAVNTSATGNGMVRKVAQQSIPSGVTASFAANTISLSAA